MQVNPMMEAIRKGLVNQQISKLNAMLKAKEEEKKADGGGKDGVSSKITVNAQGETVMVFTENGKVIRTVKLGGDGQSGGAQAISGDAQKYVDNGLALAGAVMSLGV